MNHQYFSCLEKDTPHKSLSALGETSIINNLAIHQLFFIPFESIDTEQADDEVNPETQDGHFESEDAENPRAADGKYT